MKRLTIIIILIITLTGLYFFYTNRNVIDFRNQNAAQNEIKIEEEKPAENINPITGESCENFNSRPFAVMFAGDPRTRPLSGISQADLVIEAPVFANSIYRLMALFSCEEPKEIGSVRSARHDFVPLAKGFDAIYIHWGGSHYALDLLKTGVIDNIDALRDKYSAFYRKTTIPAPDNGFTSYERLLNAADKFNYRKNTNFEGYPHLNNDEISAAKKEKSELIISYPGVYKVQYFYDPAINEYLRYRGNKPEIDKNNNQQVKIKNIIVMFVQTRQLDAEYNDLQVEGSGKAIVYRNGEEIKGIWEKDKSDMSSKLYFLDNNGEEIKLVPGKILIEITDPEIEVNWRSI